MAQSNPNNTPAIFLPLLRDLVGWWKNSHITGIVIGGIAASLLGRPRATRDIDALMILDTDQWPRVLQEAQQFGFVPRLSDALEFAMEARVLLLRHQPTAIDVDVTFGALPFEHEIIERARHMSIEDVDLLLPAPEDLIIMKAIAHRPRDLNDIEAILDAQPDLDLVRIRLWLNEFSSLMEIPEIATDTEKLLRRYEENSPL